MAVAAATGASVSGDPVSDRTLLPTAIVLLGGEGWLAGGLFVGLVVGQPDLSSSVTRSDSIVVVAVACLLLLDQVMSGEYTCCYHETPRVNIEPDGIK